MRPPKNRSSNKARFAEAHLLGNIRFPLTLTAPHAPSATQSPTVSPDYQKAMDPWIHG